MVRSRAPVKSAGAFRTIGEVAGELDVPQHVLRFWESKFPEIRPLKRGGGRRYYRPEDVDLLRRVQSLLHTEGYTIKGVQRLLSDDEAPVPVEPETRRESSPLPPSSPPDDPVPLSDPVANSLSSAVEPTVVGIPEDTRRELIEVLADLRAIRRSVEEISSE